jgi:hypothetical protein
MEIELADAVAAVRDELLAAAARGAGADVEFVVSGDVEAGVARARTHRVKVTLTPKRPGGGDLLVPPSRAAPTIPAICPATSAAEVCCGQSQSGASPRRRHRLRLCPEWTLGRDVSARG